MESQTKTKVTAEQRNQMVGAVFGKDITVAECAELTGGFFNAAYSLRLSDGRSTILKIAPSPGIGTLSYEHNIMEAEVAVLRLMKSEGSVPVPEVYAYDKSHTVFPCDFFFMEFVEGQPYNELKEKLALDEREMIETELGRYNRLINEIAGTRFGMFNESPQNLKLSWREAFMDLAASLLEDARRLELQLPVPYETIEAGLAQRAHVLDEVTEPRLVHWDLWDGNVFVREGRIAAIIDWERALWGDPLMEYYFRHFGHSSGFHKGYGAGCDSPNERARLSLYDFYLDLVMFIECYSRKYEDQGHIQWARNNLLEGWARFSAEESQG